MVNEDNPFLNEFKPVEPSLREKLLGLIYKGKKDEATEIVVKLIKSQKKVYALRDDKKEELWIYREGIYIPEGKSYIKEFCRNLLGLTYTTNFTNKVIDKIIADNYIDHDEFFNNTSVNEIPVLNGILDLKSKKLMPFTPDKIFFTKINAEYDVDKGCPNIKRFFEQILNEKDIPAMQELFGFCLWKENFTETSCLFRGAGSNGKTKTMELLKLFLNPLNCVSVPLSQLEQAGSFQVCELHNKLVNIAGELSQNALQETQMFKFLTGGDPVTADRKFLRPITFKNYAKLIFSCNDRPPTNDVSDGFFRRWIVFHFKKKFIDKSVYDKLSDKEGFGVKDTEIISKLTSPEEFSGLLNWAIEGLHRVIDNKKFSNTKSTDETRLDWLQDANNFVVFFEKNMVVSSGHLVSKDELRMIYVDFCNERNINSVSDRDILSYMKTRGVGSSRRTKDFDGSTEQIHCWVGCKFKRGSIDLRGWSSFVAQTKNEVLVKFEEG